MINIDLLKKLCNFNCVSGDEKRIRDFIIKEIKPYATDIKVDNLGNVLVFKKGESTPDKKLVVNAHMDEIGFIVTHICDNGSLKFSTVGGINKLAVPAQRVFVGENEVFGVIGLKPKHQQTPLEMSTPLEIQDLSIDIGATSKEEALKYVDIGDCVCFETYFDVKNGIIKGKALDDRAGCLILIDMIKSHLKYDTYFTFVTQEEVGLRGSKVAAYNVNPDMVLNLDVTTASDVAGVSHEKEVAQLHHGPAISFMDSATVYNREYFKLAKKTANDLGVTYQYKRATTGGNDAGSFHLSRGGAKCISLSLICRYIHSSEGIIAIEDFENWEKLSFKLIETMQEQ